MQLSSVFSSEYCQKHTYTYVDVMWGMYFRSLPTELSRERGIAERIWRAVRLRSVECPPNNIASYYDATCRRFINGAAFFSEMRRSRGRRFTALEETVLRVFDRRPSPPPPQLKCQCSLAVSDFSIGIHYFFGQYFCQTNETMRA